MTKRRNDILGSPSQTLAVADAPQGPAKEARNRLGITAEQMRGVARISPILESVGCAMESVIEALRFSQEDEAACAFLQKYDSVAPADLCYLSIDEICAASRVNSWRLLTVAVEWMVKISLMKASIELSSSLPGITKALVKNALTDRGIRDRRLLFQIAGILPTAHPAGPFAVSPETRAQKTEAQPEARPAESSEVLNRPWLRTLPGKLG